MKIVFARFSVTLLLTALIVVGCAHKDPIVGKWSGQITSSRGTSAPMSVEFKADGSDAWNITTRGMPLTTSGTYTVAGTTLTDHATSVMMMGQTMQVSGSHADVFTATVKEDTLTLTDQKSQTRFVLTRTK